MALTGDDDFSSGVVGGISNSSRQRDPIARAVRLLQMLVESESDSFGVRQLARALDVSSSTAHRLLGDLERLGLIAQTSEGHYQLGLEFYRMGWLATSRFPLRQAGSSVLRDLAQASRETAILGAYDSSQRRMMFAACIESDNPLRYVVELNQWVPLHAGATGHAILAFLPDDVRNRIVRDTGLPAVTSNTITDAGSLETELESVREQGYALSSGERIAGAIAIAAPVFGPDNNVVGDVGVTMPATRFEPSREPALAKSVINAAREVTRRMGGNFDIATS